MHIQRTSYEGRRFARIRALNSLLGLDSDGLDSFGLFQILLAELQLFFHSKQSSLLCRIPCDGSASVAVVKFASRLVAEDLLGVGL
jgi:hypothetical protein